MAPCTARWSVPTGCTDSTQSTVMRKNTQKTQLLLLSQLNIDACSCDRLNAR